MHGDLTVDVAAIITALVALVTTVGGFFVARKTTGNDADESEQKAISLSRVDETDKKVDVLFTQVDFLFDEISKLRSEKNSLENQIHALRDELRLERADHAKTKKKLSETISELKLKNDRIKALEELQNKTDRTYQEHIEYYKLTIKRDPEWYSAVKLKAKENNVSIEEMLECDAIWTYEYNILGMHR